MLKKNKKRKKEKRSKEEREKEEKEKVTWRTGVAEIVVREELLLFLR